MANKLKRFIQNDNNNAVVYARYSSDAQRDESIEQQINEAKKYCKAHGLKIIRIYTDRAISGTTSERPEYQLMLNELKVLRPGFLIAWKPDRLSRDRREAVYAKGIISDLGVRIEYVALQLPEEEADRILIESIEEALAQRFIIQHAKNVTRGLNFNAEKAFYNGRRIFGFVGRKNSRYEIDPKTGPAVTRVFRDYANGKKMSEIAEDLNNAGFKTIQNKEFTEKSIWHVLHNRAYIGEYKWADIIIQDGFPLLTTPEIFDKCQEMMEKNKRGGRGAKKKLSSNPLAGVDFWLTGHLYCGNCNAPMAGSSGTSKTGKTYFYYTCNGFKKHQCNNRNIPKKTLERIIISILNECINDPAIRLAMAERVYAFYQREYGHDENYGLAIKNHIKEVDTKLNNILNAIANGIFNDMTQNMMLSLQEQKKELENELEIENNRKAYGLKPGQVVRYLELFIGNMNEPSLRDKVLNFLVDKIIVYSDKIVVSFYYSEDKREIDIKELNSALDNIEGLIDMSQGYSDPSRKYQSDVERMFSSFEENDKMDNCEEDDFFV